MDTRKPHNFPGTSEQFVRDLVFLNNGFHLPANAEFGTPRHYPPLQYDPLQNDTLLRVYLQRTRCQPVGGHRTLRYKRLDFANLTSWPGLEIDLPIALYSLSEILPKINALYRTNLALTDIVDAAFEPMQYPVMMVANPNSLAWQGQVRIPVCFNLAEATPNQHLVGFEREEVSLTSVTPVTDLMGFDHADMVNVNDLHGFREFAG
ncbi:MAG: hypothetical protein P4L77_11435 [Sulfuriferula sp.]|nr:hypothetical protein [Sulfuriferula sp.]